MTAPTGGTCPVCQRAFDSYDDRTPDHGTTTYDGHPRLCGGSGAPIRIGGWTRALLDDETRALLAEAALVLPTGAPEYEDLRRRLNAHLDRLGPGPALPPLEFRDGTIA